MSKWRQLQARRRFGLIETLMALRGVSVLTASIIVAEIGDLKRFASAPH